MQTGCREFDLVKKQHKFIREGIADFGRSAFKKE